MVPHRLHGAKGALDMTEACVAQPRGHLSELRPRDARGFEDDSPRLHALEGILLEHLMIVAFGIDEQQVHDGLAGELTAWLGLGLKG